jgi:beta-glucosidase
VHVAKGATEHVQITLQPRELSFVDLAGDRRIAAGAYQLTIGSGGSKADAVARFTISGEQKLPE